MNKLSVLQCLAKSKNGTCIHDLTMAMLCDTKDYKNIIIDCGMHNVLWCSNMYDRNSKYVTNAYYEYI